jgi:ABC-type uncharacterized transport system YnjBCD permease subunit
MKETLVIKSKGFRYLIFFPLLLNFLLFMFALGFLFLHDSMVQSFRIVVTLIVFVLPVSFLYVCVVLFRINKELINIAELNKQK